MLAFTSGHLGYKPYFEKNDGVLTKLNLLEVFYRSLERHGSKPATEVLGTFSKYLIDFGPSGTSNAMKLRLELKKEGRDLSYADALGYFLSRELKSRLPTGDRAFRAHATLSS